MQVIVIIIMIVNIVVSPILMIYISVSPKVFRKSVYFVGKLK